MRHQFASSVSAFAGLLLQVLSGGNVIPTADALSNPPKTTNTKNFDKVSRTCYDLVVIGGGSAGLTAAKFAGDTCGRSVLLIESSSLGGDCTWTGCVPSKSLISSSKQAKARQQHDVEAEGKGTILSGPISSSTFAKIQSRYRQHQATIYQRDDSPEALSRYGVETLNGRATLKSPDSVVVTSATSDNDSYASESIEISAKEGIVICTGATPRENPIPGLDDNEGIDYVTYESIWDISELPKRLTIVGGGPVCMIISFCSCCYSQYPLFDILEYMLPPLLLFVVLTFLLVYLVSFSILPLFQTISLFENVSCHSCHTNKTTNKQKDWL